MNNYVLGLELLTIGMGTVFLSLYLLSVFLHFSGKFFGPESKNKNQNSKKVTETILKKETTLNESSQNISPKKVAAVTAVVYEMLKEENNYRILSIKKRNQIWKR